MKKLLPLIFVLLSVTTHAQVTSQTARSIRTVSTLPATCRATNPVETVIKTGASPGIYFCSATGHWSGPYNLDYSATLFTRVSTDSSGNFLIQEAEKSPGAASVALAGAGAGNVANGVHRVKVTFVTAGGETEAGTASSTVIVVDKTADGKVAITTIPTGSSFVTARNVYMTRAGGSVYYLLSNGTISNNSATTLTANDADATLLASTVAPSTNTAIDTRLTVPQGGGVKFPDGTTQTTAASAAGGSTTQLQRNISGALGGISGATSDGTDVTFGSGNLRATSPWLSTSIRDAGGNNIIGLSAVPSSVNYLTVDNAAASGEPQISATGADTDIDIKLTPKGAGTVSLTNASGLKFQDGSVQTTAATGGFSNSAGTDVVPVSDGTNLIANGTDVTLTGTNSVTLTGATESLALNTGSHNSTLVAAGRVILDAPAVRLSHVNYFDCVALTTDSDGDIGCTASDARLKNISTPFNRGLSALLNIHPQFFTWRAQSRYDDGGRRHAGLIAQNVRAAIPEAVSTTGAGVLQVEQAPLNATIINAIQELNNKVEAQAKEIASLRAQLKRHHRRR